MWGRRSLLRWECPVCGSFRIASVTENRHDDDLSTENNRDEANANIKSPSRQVWSEIEPGQVVEYRFTTSSTSVIDFSQINLQRFPYFPERGAKPIHLDPLKEELDSDVVSGVLKAAAVASHTYKKLF